MYLDMVTLNYYNALVFCSPSYRDSTKRPELQICYLLPSQCKASASFAYQLLNGGVVQFNNTSTSNNAFSSNWTFYNVSGAFTTSTAVNPQISFSGQPPYSAMLVITDSLLPNCFDSIRIDLNITNCITLQQGPTQDKNANISSYSPTLNVGASPDFMSEQWTFGGTPGEGRALVQFDLSAIPAGSIVTSAKLSVYANNTTTTSGNGYPSDPTYGNNNASYFEEITSPWAVNTIDWNNQPSTTPVNRVLLQQSVNNAENYSNLDVTQFVQDWVQTPGANYGMMLKMISSNYYNSMIFCSSSHPDTTMRPRLEVCYIPNPNVCAAAFTYWNNFDSVWFYNLSPVNYTGVSWNFGDGDTSTQNNPVHIYPQNGDYTVVLTLQDSSGGCIDTEIVQVTGINNDSLMGFVFDDLNRNGLFDAGESLMPYQNIVIDGINTFTDANGYYHVAVGGGVHTVALTLPSGWTQTAPYYPTVFSVPTANRTYVNGLDFGMYKATTGINETANQVSGLQIFPNPTNDADFNVVLPSGYEPLLSEITVYDMLGRAVDAQVVEKSAGLWKVSLAGRAQAGIYTVAIKCNGQVQCGKLTVIK
jgi:PKD repeat protein